MVQQAENIAVQEVPEVDLVCQHHWVIQAADGPTSPGLCQVCGEAKDFKNYVETATWGDTRLINRPEPVPVSSILTVKQDNWEED